MSSESSSRYMPSLDGLRAVSILLVIYSHLSVTHVLPRLIRASTLGSSAVIIFFVLSGFLITLQLKQQVQATGKIRLRDFYIRRIFRLMPALVLMLGVASIAAALGFVPLAKIDVLRGLTYTADYYHPKIWTVAHLWSLSVEEQFYLIWPLLILFAGLRGSRRFAVAALVICPLLRTAAWYGGMEEGAVFRRFEMVADSLALGCLLALERDRIRKSRIWQYLPPDILVSCSAGVIIIWSLVHRFWPAAEIAGRSFIGVSAFLIIGAVTFFPESNASRLLSWPPLVWLGKISYSLYIWQQMFLVNTPGISTTPFPFPASLTAALGVSVLSYYFFESPLRSLGKRLTQSVPSSKPPLTTTHHLPPSPVQEGCHPQAVVSD